MSTFREWMTENLSRDDIESIARFRASEGWPNLTTYADTSALYAEHEAEIWDAIREHAARFRHGTLETIANIYGARAVESQAGLEQHLVWFMADREARALAAEFAREFSRDYLAAVTGRR